MKFANYLIRLKTSWPARPDAEPRWVFHTWSRKYHSYGLGWHTGRGQGGFVDARKVYIGLFGLWIGIGTQVLICSACRYGHPYGYYFLLYHTGSANTADFQFWKFNMTVNYSPYVAFWRKVKKFTKKA